MRQRATVLATLLFVAAGAAAAFTAPSTWAAAAAADPQPVGITVELTRDIALAQSLPWVDAFSDPSLTTVRQRTVSSTQAREHLLAGDIDAAIIGTPSTGAERAAAKVGATIEVPIHVSTAMLLLSEPYSQGFEETRVVTPEQNPICDPVSADYDPSICETRSKFTGPVRVPNANLAAMMLKVSAQDLNRWRHPDVMAAMGVPNLSYPRPADAPTFVHREPGESVNLYLQKYITTAAPQVWELAKLANPGVPYEVDESVPKALTRSSPTYQAQQVGLWQNNPETNATDSSRWAGNIADIPPAVSLEAKQIYPLTPYRVIEMKNGAGQWVGPTPDSIDKAVAAGGTKPLYALDHKVDGGYPLVWVDNLSVPAKGLSPEKTNAIAGFARFVATLGQKGAAALGEGRLSHALVTEALKGADAIVKSNCVGGGVRVVSTSDLDPYAPPALAKAGLGKVSSCERVKPEAAPTPAPADSPAVSAPPADAPADPVPDTSSPSQFNEALGAVGGGGQAAAPAPALAGGGAPSKRTPVVKMPYAVLAVSGRGVDRLATLLLGAVLFLLVRATIWPRVSKRLG